MGKDSAARIEFHQMGTVNEKSVKVILCRESDVVHFQNASLWRAYKTEVMNLGKGDNGRRAPSDGRFNEHFFNYPPNDHLFGS